MCSGRTFIIIAAVSKVQRRLITLTSSLPSSSFARSLSSRRSRQQSSNIHVFGVSPVLGRIVAKTNTRSHHQLITSSNRQIRSENKSPRRRQTDSASDTEKQSVRRSTSRTARISVHHARGSRVADLAARPHHSRAVAESAAPITSSANTFALSRVCKATHCIPRIDPLHCGHAMNSLPPIHQWLKLGS